MNEYQLARSLVRLGLADVSSSLWKAQDLIADIKRNDPDWMWAPNPATDCMDRHCPSRPFAQRHYAHE